MSKGRHRGDPPRSILRRCSRIQPGPRKENLENPALFLRRRQRSGHRDHAPSSSAWRALDLGPRAGSLRCAPWGAVLRSARNSGMELAGSTGAHWEHRRPRPSAWAGGADHAAFEAIAWRQTRNLDRRRGMTPELELGQPSPRSLSYATFIDAHRRAILLASIVLAVGSAVLASRLAVEGDFSHLLPPSQSRCGLGVRLQAGRNCAVGNPEKADGTARGRPPLDAQRAAEQ